MSGEAYGPLARWYDGFTRDVPYGALADFYEGALRRKEGPMTLLDLCCGTGTVLLLLAARGHELIGVDASPDMLAVASGKAGAAACPVPPLLLCQEAAELDLYGTVEGAYCCLDGLNYLPPGELPALFHRLHLFIEPGGRFAFDIHAPAHLRALDGGAFVDETEDALCLWRGEFDGTENALFYGMDLFTRRADGLWERAAEEHLEYAHDPAALSAALLAAGFSDVEPLAGPVRDGDRLFFRAVNGPHAV